MYVHHRAQESPVERAQLPDRYGATSSARRPQVDGEREGGRERRGALLDCGGGGGGGARC